MQGLLIIGSLPETSGIGGVTIHVSRLLELLEERKIMYSFIDYRTASIFSILKSILRNKVIHLHATNSYFKFFLFFLEKLSRNLQNASKLPCCLFFRFS